MLCHVFHVWLYQAFPITLPSAGGRSMEIFADDRNRLSYLQFLAEESARFGVTFMGWCLMTNHVHLIAVPEREESLARAIGEAHLSPLLTLKKERGRSRIKPRVAYQRTPEI